MSHVDFKKYHNYVMSFIISLVSIDPMSHVDFKKWPCRRVEFRGQGPHLHVKDHISIGPWHNMPSDIMIDVHFNSSLIGP